MKPDFFYKFSKLSLLPVFVVIFQIKLININIEFEVIWQKLQDLDKFPKIETYMARFCEERLVSFLEIHVSNFFRHILLFSSGFK